MDAFSFFSSGQLRKEIWCGGMADQNPLPFHPLHPAPEQEVVDWVPDGHTRTIRLHTRPFFPPRGDSSSMRAARDYGALTRTINAESIFLFFSPPSRHSRQPRSCLFTTKLPPTPPTAGERAATVFFPPPLFHFAFFFPPPPALLY